MSKKSADGIARGDTPGPGVTTRPVDPAPQRMPPEFEASVDESLGLKLISLRMQTRVIAQMKRIGEARGIGYQPLMREVLTEYARNETLRLTKLFAAHARASKDLAD